MFFLWTGKCGTQLCIEKHLCINKKTIIDEILDSCDIQFQWSMELDEKEEYELLKKVAQLWLTIRGFSIASAFAEQYKQLTQKCTKNPKVWEKHLKHERSDFTLEE